VDIHPLQSDLQPAGFECLFLTVGKAPTLHCILVIYRPYWSSGVISVCREFSEILQQIDRSEGLDRLIVVGDFNLAGKTSKTINGRLQRLLDANKLNQLVPEAETQRLTAETYLTW
jgi:hypothetical protein